MSFIENILDLIEKHNITNNKMLTDLQISKNSMNDWKNRGTIPSGDTVLKIAQYFHVTTDYLLTGENPLPQDATQLEKQLLLFFRQLTPESQESAVTMVGGLTLNSKYVKKSNETAATGLNQTIA
jgi:transcriptional regulator with XRE-family HTH domain